MAIDGSPGAVTAIDLGRPQGRIERRVSARYTVPHGDFESALETVIDKATALSGFVVETSTEPDSSGRIASGYVVVRVPADKLSTLVAGLDRKRFEPASINYSSIDHTAETVDVDARLRSSTTHRDALLQLLAKATSIGDIVAVEQQVAQVQQEIDQEQGQANALATAVDLATGRFDLVEAGLAPVPKPGSSSILDAMRTGLNNADAVIAGTILTVTSALPILGVGAVLIWLARRRWTRAGRAGA